MVKEQDGVIILDNGISVLPIFNNYWSKCKKNLPSGGHCYQCQQYPYESVINLGYYFSGWFRMKDCYIRADIKKTFDLNLINPKYKFSKLINDSKRRWHGNTISDKKATIKILGKGFAWKMLKYENQIVKIIDIIVHIPKKEENPDRDDL